RQLMTCGRHHLVALLLRSAAGWRSGGNTGGGGPELAARRLSVYIRQFLRAFLTRNRRGVRSLRADMSVLRAWHTVAGFTRHFLSPTDSPSRLSTRTAQSRPAAA